MTLPLKAKDLAWCRGGPTCTAEFTNRDHHDCPDKCGQSTSQGGKVIRECRACGNSGFCVSWLTHVSMWACKRCKDRAWAKRQAELESRQAQTADMFEHERGAEQQSTFRKRTH